MSTIAEIFQKLDSNITADPEKATSVDALFQFDLTGDEGGSWSVDLRSGTTSGFVKEGPAENPRVTISVSTADWKGIIDGSVNPMQAFMMGKIKVSGDMGLAMKLQNILALAK
jgi:putative sterol carrier protein